MPYKKEVIGIEVNEEYYNMAKRRILGWATQKRLF